LSRVIALAVAVLLLGNRMASAREPATTMAGLRARLATGTEVDVVDRQGRLLRGQFVRADDEGLLVVPHGTAQARRVAARDVFSVSRPGDSVMNGALIGAGFGLLPVAVLANKPGDFASVEVLSMVATYAAIGALIDLAMKGRTLAYRSTAYEVSWSVAPRPGARGAGVQMTLKF
jgi:hypothetical protein